MFVKNNFKSIKKTMQRRNTTLEQLQKEVKPYAIEYDGVFYALYTFLDKIGKGEKVTSQEIEKAIDEGVKYVPSPTKEFIINKMINHYEN